MVVIPARTAIISLVLISLILSAACVSSARPTVPAVPTPTPTKAPVILANESQPLVKIEVSDASDLDLEEEFMYRTHGRYLNESFRVSRTNVSGDKDLYLDISVYNFRFLRNYHETAAEDWGTFKWWLHQAPQGQKFLFVFVRVEMEGTNQRNDPRIWGFESSHFGAQIGNSFAPQDWGHTSCIAIQEMEDTGNFNDESRVSDYGKQRVQSLANGEVECQDPGWLRMGQSNEWDGYLIYVVPESLTEKDVRIVGNFDAFGDAWWKLTRRPS